ncbi:MAG: hypothetical protein RL660_458 [Bacteroidota bacterium]|jgi:hypothetical protein
MCTTNLSGQQVLLRWQQFALEYYNPADLAQVLRRALHRLSLQAVRTADDTLDKDNVVEELFALNEVIQCLHSDDPKDIS